MFLTCPKCGDYYADGPSAFCLADGTPLVEVEPDGEGRGEAARAVEEKSRAQLKERRGLKRRRILRTATTVMVVIMVVCVAAVNGYIYLRPEPEKDVWVGLLTPAPGPTPVPAPPLLPIEKPSPTPTPGCSAEDKSRAREAIVGSHGGAWRDEMQRVCHGIIIEDGPAGVRRAEAEPARPDFAFARTCSPVVVTADYKCRGERRVNGVVEPVSVPKTIRVECRGAGDAWRCR
jgi:hypothetical protein